MNRIKLGVSGITNSKMKTSLKNALNKIDGVQSIDIDKTIGTVAIGYNAPANENQIKNCVEETGFSLT